MHAANQLLHNKLVLAAGVAGGVGAAGFVLAGCGSKTRDVGWVTGDQPREAGRTEHEYQGTCDVTTTGDNGTPHDKSDDQRFSSSVPCTKTRTEVGYVEGDSAEGRLTVDYGWYSEKGFASAADAIRFVNSADATHFMRYIQDAAVIVKNGGTYDVVTGKHNLHTLESADISDPSVVAVFDA